MNEVLTKLGLNETFTKRPKRYQYPKVKDSTYPMRGYNYQADLLMLPETPDGYRYLFVIIDLWSDYFDCEPMITKTAEAAKTALEEVLARKEYVKEIKASIKTDAGSEFKGAFDKYLKDNKIAHIVAMPGRHTQLANVNNLCLQLGRILMTYLENKTSQLAKKNKKGDEVYSDWTDILDKAVDELNAFKDHRKDEDPVKYPFALNESHLLVDPKYNVGDIVYRPIQKPTNRYGEALMSTTFRMGDRRYEDVPRKIARVLLYATDNPYRYMLLGFNNVSYAENELIPSDEKQEKYVVVKIRDKMMDKKVLKYLVQWKGYRVADSTWEAATELIEDGLEDYITAYEDAVKENKKKSKKK